MYDRIDDVYGVVDRDTLTHASILAESLVSSAASYDPRHEQFGYSLADVRCAAVEAVNNVDLPRLLELEQSADFDNPSQELVALSNQFLEAIVVGHEKCISDPLYQLDPGIHRNFSEETVACVREDIGDVPAFAEGFEALLTDTSLTESEFVLQFEIQHRQLTDTVEGCHSTEEAKAFEEWLDFINGGPTTFSGGEPESLST